MAENTANTSNELKRLLDLQTPELMKELNEARERFREYLRKHGIEVPNMLIVDQPEGVSGEPGRSILLDDFNAQTIKAIDKSVITVYSTADSFLKLFETLPSSRTLEDMTVTIDGKPPCTAKDLFEQVKGNSTPKDAQLVVASSDLKSLLGDLDPNSSPDKGKPKESAKVASLDDSDLDSIYDKGNLPPPPPPPKAAPKPQQAPTPKIQEPPAQAAAPAPGIQKPVTLGAPPPLLKPKESEKDKAFEQSGRAMPPSSRIPLPSPLVVLSASIAQADFDELFKMSEEDFEKLSNPSVEEAAGEATVLNQNELDSILAHVETISQGLPLPENSNIDQGEIDSFLPAKPSVASKPDNASVGQNEIDAFLSASKPQKASPLPSASPAASVDQNEIDALLSGKSAPVASKPDTSTLSQNDLDALFGVPKSTPAPAANVPVTNVDQSEIDALLSGKSTPVASKPDTSTLSQNDLDALFGAPKSTSASAPVANVPATSVDQSEIDALLSKASTPPIKAALPVKNENLSQDDLDALFSTSAKTVEKPAVKKEDAFALDLGISQDELDKAITAKPEKSKSYGILDVADDTEGITQEVIDKAFGNAKAKAKPAPAPVLAKAAEPEPVGGTDISQAELDKLFGAK